MKNLTTVNNNFINYIIAFLFLSSAILFFILHINVEKSFDALMNIDEDKSITLIIDSTDAYFIKDHETINFIINNKLYVVNDVVLIPLPNNLFSIEINNKDLDQFLQPSTTLKININTQSQKLYELLFKLK
ncbi:MAG: MAG1140 family protein [Metamycoplasmataceae bacterium]